MKPILIACTLFLILTACKTRRAVKTATDSTNVSIATKTNVQAIIKTDSEHSAFTFSKSVIDSSTSTDLIFADSARLMPGGSWIFSGRVKVNAQRQTAIKTQVNTDSVRSFFKTDSMYIADTESKTDSATVRAERKETKSILGFGLIPIGLMVLAGILLAIFHLTKKGGS